MSAAMASGDVQISPYAQGASLLSLLRRPAGQDLQVVDVAVSYC